MQMSKWLCSLLVSIFGATFAMDYTNIFQSKLGTRRLGAQTNMLVSREIFELVIKVVQFLNIYKDKNHGHSVP